MNRGTKLTASLVLVCLLVAAFGTTLSAKKNDIGFDTKKRSAITVNLLAEGASDVYAIRATIRYNPDEVTLQAADGVKRVEPVYLGAAAGERLADASYELLNAEGQTVGFYSLREKKPGRLEIVATAVGGSNAALANGLLATIGFDVNGKKVKSTVMTVEQSELVVLENGKPVTAAGASMKLADANPPSN